MNIEEQPISVFVKKVLLRTPQGLLVVANFVFYWVLSLIILLPPKLGLVVAGADLNTLILFIPWPFVVLLVNVVLSSPRYDPNPFVAVVVAVFACLPLWWVYT